MVPAYQALCHVFDPNDLVCAGPNVWSAEVRLLKEWATDAEHMQFVCPNPMRGRYAERRDGKRSVRCQDNVLTRRHLIAEFDTPHRTKEEQAKLLTVLGSVMPLWLVVDSGGKSLHGWFRVGGQSTRDIARFFAKCCLLGADPAMWNSASWVRMPGGLRQGTVSEPVRQRVLYLGAEKGGAV